MFAGFPRMQATVFRLSLENEAAAQERLANLLVAALAPRWKGPVIESM
jgi:hypothetical protein